MSSTRQKFVPWALFLGVFAAVFVLAFWGMEGRPVHAAKAAAAADSEVLAKVGDTEVRAADVEALIASDLTRLARERHEAMQQGLERAVRERLLELEAESRGVTTDELLETEIASKVPAVDDAQVDAFYEQNKAQIRASKEQVAGQIRQYLQQQQQAGLTEGLIKTLKAKYDVESYLEPLRIEVASDGFPSKGGADAAVTIVEFSDFECPYCSRVLPSLEQVMENYGDDVRVVFRQFPLNSIHPRAQKAAEASLCAHEQGKFWEMHDLMFEEQKSLTVDQLKEKAARIGLETDAFNQCLDSGEFADEVAADLQAGAAVGVSGTPAMFINGRFINGAVGYDALAAIVDEELARADAGS